MMSSEERKIHVLTQKNWDDYALLDSGNGKKLERFGAHIVARPEAQAMWRPRLAEEEWNAADGVFESDGEEKGKWHFKEKRESWEMRYGDLKFAVRPTPFRHMGVFPECAVHWDWMRERVRKAGREAKVLELFGYTGLASLSVAAEGAYVTYLDASPKMASWARENQKLSGLEDKSIRWIVDDALKFVKREARRGAAYDGFIIDPPKFGRGPKGEIWDFYDSLPELLNECKKLLSGNPLFAILTSYAIRSSALSLGPLMEELMETKEGEIECGELGVKEESGGRILPQAIFVRWGKANDE